MRGWAIATTGETERLAARFRRTRGPDPWLVGAAVVALAVTLPILAVVYLALFPSENVWPHLVATVLPDYVTTTIALMAGVAFGTALLGVGAAWLVATCQFPFRATFEWALVLPLAVPAYVVAYVYTDKLEFAGPVQGALRALFGWTSASDYWFPEIRSLGGAVFVMSFSLYPYAYLLARTAFAEQSAAAMEAARTLGASPWRMFRRVSLPMARPSLFIGVALALMETLNDFGTVDYFAVHTFTAGIYNVWLTMNNTGGGAQIALVLLGFVMVLVAGERLARRRRAYHVKNARTAPFARFALSGARAWIAALACLFPIAVGFLVPCGVLLGYAIDYFDVSWSSRFPGAALHSLGLSAAAAGAGVVVGLFLAYAVRLGRARWLRALTRIASLGYAVPGAVIALGVLIPFGAFDNWLGRTLEATLGIAPGLLLSGTVFAVLFAYVARFLALSFGTIEAGLARITPTVEAAARSLGHGPASTLLRIDLPMLRGSLITAAMLIFVDCMKELPATLVLRPFNFDTLATYVYEFASDERLEQCALGALAIVAAGLIPVILLNRALTRNALVALERALPRSTTAQGANAPPSA